MGGCMSAPFVPSPGLLTSNYYLYDQLPEASLTSLVSCLQDTEIDTFLYLIYFSIQMKILWWANVWALESEQDV